MELITGLFILSILVLLPMALAGQEVFQTLFLNSIRTTNMQNDEKHGEGISTGQDENTVFDGMATVEIPISEPQVVAYETLSGLEEERKIVIVPPPRSARA